MNVALLSGAHSHTAGYLKTIRESAGELTLAVVWDDMPSRGQAIAQEMGCPFVADLDDALSVKGLDLTCICADNAGHRPLVEASCRAGLDCFCEKPMALSVEDADAMLAAIRASGVLAVFGFFQPYTGGALALRKFLAEGGLGELSQINYRNSHHAAYGRWFDSPEREWFHDPAKAGGGAFADMGAHAMHFVRLVFGPVADISARIVNQSGVYPRVDDQGIALVGMASGATGVIEASWVAPGGPSGLEVWGSKGYARLQGDRCIVRPFAGNKVGEEYTLEPLPAEPTRLERLVALKKGLLDREACLAELEACRDAVAISVAAYQSNDQGERVKVDN